MFDRVSEISKKPFSNGEVPSTEALDAGPLEAILDEEESIQYVLASTASVKHATDEKTARIEPGEGCNAYLVVTNRRIFVVMGDDPDDPEVTLALADVDAAEIKEGLVRTRLVVRTAEERVGFVPADLDAAKVVASYVERIGSAWSDLHKALAKVEAAMNDVEATIDAGEDPRNDVQLARTRISNAYHCATHHDDAPTALMKAQIEPVEADLNRLRVEPRVERVESLILVATEAREAEDFERAFEAVTEGLGHLADAKKALKRVDLDLTDVGGRIDEYEAELTDGAGEMFDGAEQACLRALDADESGPAVDAWDTAMERYRGALAADWDGHCGVGQSALQFQLAWVVSNLVDALEARATAREAVADDLGEEHEDAADRYEAAHQDLVRARDLAAEHPHLSADPFQDPVERLGEKAEHAKWEWGAADD